MTKKISLVLAAFLAVGSVAGCVAPSTPTVTSTSTSTAPTQSATITKAAKFKATKPTESVSQKQARLSAEGYLTYQSFSRVGLIKQLKFEGFSTKDATYGVNALSTDWRKQAAKTAKGYLDHQNFSRSGLIQQLLFEGFTRQQATYGVNKTGL